MIYAEKDEAWIELFSFVGNKRGLDFHHPFIWLNDKKEFLWMSEKDGWSHMYRVATDGSKEVLITKGEYDVIDFLALDEKSNYVYFLASPGNATQKYLYKTKLDGKGKLELVTPAGLQGTHSYDISPSGTFTAACPENRIAPPSNTANASGAVNVRAPGSIVKSLADSVLPRSVNAALRFATCTVHAMSACAAVISSTVPSSWWAKIRNRAAWRFTRHCPSLNPPGGSGCSPANSGPTTNSPWKSRRRRSTVNRSPISRMECTGAALRTRTTATKSGAGSNIAG